jgi:LDH2 family malate/lactate/ureidoglycolate dehydrogenase
VFDAAFANTAHGKIRVYAQKGVAIPADWAFDAEGRATTDPLQALMGLLQPAGGHKGIAMAMGVGVLSSLLSGAAYGTQSGNMRDGPVPGVDGHFVMLIQIAAFLEPAAFKARTDELVREIHASRRAPGVERLFVPGEIEDETERRYRALGIPLNDATWADLRRIAARLALGGRELECIAA